MNRKLLLTAIFVTVFTVAAVIFTSYTRPETTESRDSIPFASLPLCESADRVISLLEDGSPVCSNQSSLYVIQMRSHIKIAELQTNEKLITGTLGFFIGATQTKITLYRVIQPIALEKVYEFAITEEITPVSVFLMRTDDQLVFYVSAQKEATSPSSVKSIHYRISVPTNMRGTARTPSLSTLATQEMLRITDSYYGGDLVLLRELLPFLEPKYRIARWTETPALIPAKDSIAEFITSTGKPYYRTRDKKYFTVSGNGSSQEVAISTISDFILIHDSFGFIEFNLSENALVWHKGAASSKPAVILAHLPTTQLELVGRYHTRIGKRVYNCFDFSESLQITLRVCIPQL
jgi:hypothetical protein